MEIGGSALSNEYEISELNFAKIEKVLNVCSYVPGICQISGFVRGLLGITQTVSGLAAAIFLRLQSMQKMDKKHYQDRALRNEIVVCHGLANLFRASIETTFIADYLITTGIRNALAQSGNVFWFEATIASIVVGFYDVSRYRFSYIAEPDSKKNHEVAWK